VTHRDTFGLEDLHRELIRDEGFRTHIYKDPGSGHAIGYARNLDSQGINPRERFEFGITDEMLTPDGPGITQEQAMGLFNNDIWDRVHQLDVYIPWWRLLSPARQRALLNMAYEMGSRGMLKTQAQFIYALERGLYEDAAVALENSEWHHKVPKRPDRIVAMIRDAVVV
jgi:lysozyme